MKNEFDANRALARTAARSMRDASMRARSHMEPRESRGAAILETVLSAIVMIVACAAGAFGVALAAILLL